jgi:hypothetical protein
MAPHTLVLRLFDFAKAPDAAKNAKAMGVCRYDECLPLLCFERV